MTNHLAERGANRNFIKYRNTLIFVHFKYNKENILRYLCNLGSLRYRNGYCITRRLWGKQIFLQGLKPLQSRSVTARPLVRALNKKNKPMAQQQSCMSLWRRSPPEPARMGGATWLYKRAFHHRIWFGWWMGGGPSWRW